MSAESSLHVALTCVEDRRETVANHWRRDAQMLADSMSASS